MGAMDFVVIGVVVAALALVLFFYFRGRSKRGGCATGCGGCPYADGCARFTQEPGADDKNENARGKQQ